MKHKRRLLAVAIILPLVVLAYFAININHYAGAGRLGTGPIEPGPYLPPPAPGPSESESHYTQLGMAVIDDLAKRELPFWEEDGKINAPRILLANIVRGSNIADVNGYIQRLRPWGNAGSSWALNPLGDYDFTMTVLVSMLYLFQDEPSRLYPDSRTHIVHELLTEKGRGPRLPAPRTLGLVLDTENHHLMTESARYLTNQWLRTRDGWTGQQYNNRANGLEAWLIAYLEEMLDEGIYEFNSIPYFAYTLHPLMNLEAFAESEEIRSLSRHILDIANLEYALGSLDFRRHAPFRRKIERGEGELSTDPHTAAMRVWMSEQYTWGDPLPAVTVHRNAAFAAALLPYRPSPDVAHWTQHKPAPYFAIIGRGAGASPEIYSGGPGYLLSAGGVHRGRRSMIRARPISLMLSDGAQDLSECFHIVGKGDWRQWNNTGVHQNFAVANGPVHVPAAYEPVAEDGEWRVYAPESVPGLLIAVVSREDFGLIALFPESLDSPEELLTVLTAYNHAPHALRRAFTWPDRSVIHYSVDTPAGTWVLHSWRGDPFERDYDNWPRLDGILPQISFARSVFNYGIEQE